MLKDYDGYYWKREGKDILKTKEGKEAVEKAIEMLRRQEACSPITNEPHLETILRTHIKAIGEKGLTTATDA